MVDEPARYNNFSLHYSPGWTIQKFSSSSASTSGCQPNAKNPENQWLIPGISFIIYVY
jgi:hypothetical protein